MLSEKAKKVISTPFSEEFIRTKPGYGNKRLRYVEGCEYIRRLNEAFDYFWSFEVIESKIYKEEIVVKGKLTVQFEVDMVSKEAFGGATIKRKKDGSGVISLADDFKSAATDALKKASSMIGIGLHLYGDYGEIWEKEKAEKLRELRGEISDIFKAKGLDGKDTESSQKRAEILHEIWGKVTWTEIEKAYTETEITSGIARIKDMLKKEKK